MGLIALFLCSVFISQFYNMQRKAADQKTRLEQIGKLQFKGKVINTKNYKYYGKNYYIVCVKLDSTANDIYIYNDLDCIKIKHGIATFSAGFLNHTLGAADSIAVNINNSDKIVFHYKDNAEEKFPLGFEPMGMHEDDLKACD